MTDRLVGVAFPFRIAGGGVGVAHGSDKIEQDVLHLLGTRAGERVMMRTYGGGVHHRRQEPNDATLRALVRHEVELALRAFVPEVRLVSPLTVTAIGDELRIVVDYAINPLDVVRRLELTV